MSAIVQCLEEINNIFTDTNAIANILFVSAQGFIHQKPSWGKQGIHD